MTENKSENYWNMIKESYPHHVAVAHLSAADLDPRVVNAKVTKHFKRVPVFGVAHFGFARLEDLNKFKRLAGLK